MAKTIAAARADAATTGSEVLVLRAHQLRETDIDVGGDGFGPGDYFLFEERLRGEHGPTILGRDSIRCTLGPTTVVCDGTAQIFGEGEINVYGAFFSDADNRISVVGGTGVYQGAGGQLTVEDGGHGTTILIFELMQ